MVNAVIFDVDDTLYDQQAPFNQAIINIFPEVVADINFDLAYKRFRYHSDETFCLYTAGEWTLSFMRFNRINKTLQDCGFPAINEATGLAFQQEYNQQLETITLLPEAEKILSDLSANNAIKVGIITNGPTDHQYKKIKQLNVEKFVTSDNILISEATGFAKPDPRIFDLAVKEFGLTPEETLYVGDNFDNDVDGAKSAGWQALWFNHRDRIEPDSCYCPDKAINTFAALPKAIMEMTTK